MEGIKIISDKIKKYRKECGYTQKRLAELLEIDRSTYAYYESGRIKPDINNVMKLCKIFNVNYEDILESESETQNNLHDSNFPCNNLSSGSNYMYNLTKKEQEIILYYRLLSPEKKEEIREEIIKRYKDK